MINLSPKDIFVWLFFIFYICTRSFFVHGFIKDFGREKIVDYSKYGVFEGAGTINYKYVIKDRRALGEAQGEGIYPNAWGIHKNSGFIKAKEKGFLEGNRWDFVNIDNYALSYYKWATSLEEHPGVRQFYVAHAFERHGFIEQAIKAYYTIVVCFPKTVSKTYWKHPWYVGEVALNRIKYLCSKYPKLKLEIKEAKIEIKNKFDNLETNDSFIIWPGQLIANKKIAKIETIDLEKLGRADVKEFGKILLVKYNNGHWKIFVNDLPWIIKGMVYAPTPVGQSPHKEGTYKDWMKSDINNNGIIDAPYEAWVDKNNNNIKDKNEEPAGDFVLLKEMGVNTIRLYHHAQDKNILRDLYMKYGIMCMIGDLLGMYTVGSGALWEQGTDYTNTEHCRNMMASVEEMVYKHKDEPYVFMWVLGNENNYANAGIDSSSMGFGCRGGDQPEAFYSFADKAAKRIKEIDPNHPVAICNGDLLYLDLFAKYCPNIDIFTCNVYRGTHGFGYSFWNDVSETIDKPIVIAEYGCPAFYWGKKEKEAQQYQKDYHKNSWEDIFNNTAGRKGSGKCLGAVVFEWIDEWWKAYFPFYHDRSGQWAGPFPDGWMYEEWLGVCSQGNGKNSPFLRQMRETYFYYKEVWNE
ncbi:glycoside hydrolase family 2 TIM barrel-domain containing protein [bacterium]